MNRLEKKCFVTAAAAHALLFVILFVGPAFFVPADKENSFKEITLYSPADITKTMSSGGTPENVRANPLPPSPAPTPDPPPVERIPKPPDIPKSVVRPQPDLDPVKPDLKIKPPEHGDDPLPPKKKHVVTLSDSDLTSSKPDKNKLKQAADDARKAQAAAEARQRAQDAKAFGNALKSLKNTLSGATIVSMPVGAGGGGAASVNYRDLIASKYYNAWNPSFSLNEDTSDVTAVIIVSRDGSVTGHITKHSGVSSMDKSVQSALDAVTFIEPFPESFTEQQMTIPIVFNLRVKRQ